MKKHIEILFSDGRLMNVETLEEMVALLQAALKEWSFIAIPYISEYPNGNLRIAVDDPKQSYPECFGGYD